jgi:hypothetical protein
LDAVADPRVAAAMGARSTRAGDVAPGGAAMRVRERTSKPVTLVAPDVVGTASTLGKRRQSLIEELHPPFGYNARTTTALRDIHFGSRR